jgi:DNA-binding LacI/PurR family transcriptional regulator
MTGIDKGRKICQKIRPYPHPSRIAAEVLIEHTGGNWDQEISLIKGLRHHLIDGAILSPLALSTEDLQQAHQHGLHLVLIGERFQDNLNNLKYAKAHDIDAV